MSTKIPSLPTDFKKTLEMYTTWRERLTLCRKKCQDYEDLMAYHIQHYKEEGTPKDVIIRQDPFAADNQNDDLSDAQLMDGAEMAAE